MKLFRLFVLAALPLFGLAAFAQTPRTGYVWIYAHQISDASGPTSGMLQSGQLCFQGTDQFNKPINYRAGTAGVTVTRPACYPVVNGAIPDSTLQIARSDQSSPANVNYHITITDNNTGDTVVDYANVQVVGTDPFGNPNSGSNTFYLDSYKPTTAVGIVTQGPAGTVTLNPTQITTPNVMPGITNTGTDSNALLTFTLPRAPYLTMNPVQVVNPNVAPSVTDTVTNGDHSFTFNLPSAAQLALGTVSTGAAGSAAAITDSGVNGNHVLNFTIPKGDPGTVTANGTNGDFGVPGTLSDNAGGTPNFPTGKGATQRRVDVKEYGAKGDGVTDDTAAVQAAIAAAHAAGVGTTITTYPIIYVPAGRYKISDTLYIRRSDTLEGDGGDGSALILTHPTHDLLFVVNYATGYGVYGAYAGGIRKLRLEGQGHATTGNLVSISAGGGFDLTDLHLFNHGGRGIVGFGDVERTAITRIKLNEIRWPIVWPASAFETVFRDIRIMNPGSSSTDNFCYTPGLCDATWNAATNTWTGTGQPVPTMNLLPFDRGAFYLGGGYVIKAEGMSIKATSYMAGYQINGAQHNEFGDLYCEGYPTNTGSTAWPRINPCGVFGGPLLKTTLTGNMGTGINTPTAVADPTWIGTAYMGNPADYANSGNGYQLVIARPPDYVYGDSSASVLGGGILKNSCEYIYGHFSTDGFTPTLRGWNLLGCSTTAIAWPATTVIGEAPGRYIGTGLYLKNIHNTSANAASPSLYDSAHWGFTCSQTTATVGVPPCDVGDLIGYLPDDFFAAPGATGNNNGSRPMLIYGQGASGPVNGAVITQNGVVVMEDSQQSLNVWPANSTAPSVSQITAGLPLYQTGGLTPVNYNGKYPTFTFMKSDGTIKVTNPSNDASAAYYSADVVAWGGGGYDASPMHYATNYPLNLFDMPPAGSTQWLNHLYMKGSPKYMAGSGAGLFYDVWNGTTSVAGFQALVRPDYTVDLIHTGNLSVGKSITQQGTGANSFAGMINANAGLTVAAGQALKIGAANVATQGVDINASNQVTATHLASPLPTAQGGTGQNSTAVFPASGTLPTVNGTPATGHCVTWASATSIGDGGSGCSSGAVFPQQVFGQTLTAVTASTSGTLVASAAAGMYIVHFDAFCSGGTGGTLTVSDSYTNPVLGALGSSPITTVSLNGNIRTTSSFDDKILTTAGSAITYTVTFTNPAGTPSCSIGMAVERMY